MPVRIQATDRKVSLVVIAYVAAAGGGAMLSTLIGGVASAITVSFVSAIVAAYFARTFRGPGEPIAPPRPWWKMSATTLTGYIWSAVFAVHAVLLLPVAVRKPLMWIPVLIAIMIAAAFFQSAVRLRSHNGGRLQRSGLLRE